jgi:hypothetical protein
MPHDCTIKHALAVAAASSVSGLVIAVTMGDTPFALLFNDIKY